MLKLQRSLQPAGQKLKYSEETFVSLNLTDYWNNGLWRNGKFPIDPIDPKLRGRKITKQTGNVSQKEILHTPLTSYRSPYGIRLKPRQWWVCGRQDHTFLDWDCLHVHVLGLLFKLRTTLLPGSLTRWRKGLLNLFVLLPHVATVRSKEMPPKMPVLVTIS